MGHSLPDVVTCADISAIGPLTRGAEDLDLALDAMSGPDDIDGVAWKLDLPKCSATSLKDLRIAVKLSDACSDVDAEYVGKLQALVDALAKRGAKVKEIEPDLDTRRLHEVYVYLLRAATSARTREADIERWKRAAEEAGPGKLPYVEQMVKGCTLSHREWLSLNNERMVLRRQFNASSPTGISSYARLLRLPPGHTIRRASAGSGRSPSTTSASRRPISCSGLATQACSICLPRSDPRASHDRGSLSATKRLPRAGATRPRQPSAASSSARFWASYHRQDTSDARRRLSHAGGANSESGIKRRAFALRRLLHFRCGLRHFDAFYPQPTRCTGAHRVTLLFLFRYLIGLAPICAAAIDFSEPAPPVGSTVRRWLASWYGLAGSRS